MGSFSATNLSKKSKHAKWLLSFLKVYLVSINIVYPQIWTPFSDNYYIIQ